MASSSSSVGPSFRICAAYSSLPSFDASRARASASAASAQQLASALSSDFRVVVRISQHCDRTASCAASAGCQRHAGGGVIGAGLTGAGTRTHHCARLCRKMRGQAALVRADGDSCSAVAAQPRAQCRNFRLGVRCEQADSVTGL